MNASTLPQPEPTRNPTLNPTTLDRADAMLGHLRSIGPGFGHEFARAMLVSAAFYLRETFGREHAISVTASLVPPVLGVGEAAPEPAPPEPEPPSADLPAATLH